MLDRYNQYTGDPGYLPKDVARYEAVTTASDAEVRRQKYSGQEPARGGVLRSGQEGDGRCAAQPGDTDADVKIVPPYTPEFETRRTGARMCRSRGRHPKLASAGAEDLRLDNGLKVFLVKSTALPVLSAALVTRAGGEKQSGGQAGHCGTLRRAMLTEGTATRTSTQLADDTDADWHDAWSLAAIDGQRVGERERAEQQHDAAWTCCRTWCCIRRSRRRKWSGSASSGWWRLQQEGDRADRN